MLLHFDKYQGTGNDFILIDNREGKIQLSATQIGWLCHRRFGIGADGLMLLENESGYDFKMVYYNADGNESTMCGNGGRCITAFAHRLGIMQNNARFIAIDGEHYATILADGTVSLQMQDVKEMFEGDGYVQLNTGSPHYVLFSKDVQQTDVYTEGKRIRNLDRYQPKGINVNFTEHNDNGIFVRTYERGVEDETLSCGTGVTAAAIAVNLSAPDGEYTVNIDTPGGKLCVSYAKNGHTATNVVLTGNAVFVYTGTVEVEN
ncbi:diaminopimelate epimerase [Chitinophagaceae bacterium IBVUCB1]|nr:diaminopimelate epimerase [Chitinophagaceae bacterium IBVUCB1]